MSTTGAAGGGPVTAAGDGAVTPVAERPVTTGRLRRVFLGPQGGGTLRRRASDAFRLGFAILVVAASIPVMRANSDAEIAIVHALNPPPAAIGTTAPGIRSTRPHRERP